MSEYFEAAVAEATEIYPRFMIIHDSPAESRTSKRSLDQVVREGSQILHSLCWEYGLTSDEGAKLFTAAGRASLEKMGQATKRYIAETLGKLEA